MNIPSPVAAAERTPRERLLILLALVAVYLIWGSTYLGIRYALEGFAPFQLGAIRFTLAGILMLAWLRLRGAKWPTPAQWKNCAITGTLLLVGGNGLVCYAEQTVSSSLAAVAVASMPLFAAVIAGAYGKWPGQRDWIGLVIGFAGVIVLNFGGDMRGSPAGAIALFFAPLTWAFGSVWSRQHDMPEPFMSTAAQMLLGGIALGIVSLALREPMPHDVPAIAWGAIIYLTIAGSMVAFTAYIYLLNTVRPALATSYAYVNPPIAVLMGVLIASEAFGWIDAIAMAVILVGVFVIVGNKK